MILIPGPASEKLGRKIASILKINPHPVKHRIFPDGESYIRFTSEDLSDDVLLIQTTAPDPDRKIMQLLMMAKTAKAMGAKSLIACVPYLSYSRQDKRFREGEVFSLDIVLGLMDSSGIDDLIVIDIHNKENTLKLSEKYDMCVHCLDAIPAIANYLKDNNYDGAYSISPDIGRKELVQSASKILGGGFGYFEKIRDLETGEIVMEVRDLDIIGRKAVVFDDIISSGGTMSRAIKGLKDQGATKVAAACTHALLMEGAEQRLREAGAEKIIASDTIQTDYSEVTVAEIIAKHIISI
ncbi:ribose-phosphate diphosphokinase [Candidatus Bathyarchaeota archaeon]|nr:ribose-phosphate diphosphokinase [Candidatus Bathyarchaeota archaeon]